MQKVWSSVKSSDNQSEIISDKQSMIFSDMLTDKYFRIVYFKIFFSSSNKSRPM